VHDRSKDDAFKIEIKFKLVCYRKILIESGYYYFFNVIIYSPYSVVWAPISLLMTMHDLFRSARRLFRQPLWVVTEPISSRDNGSFGN